GTAGSPAPRRTQSRSGPAAQGRGRPRGFPSAARLLARPHSDPAHTSPASSALPPRRTPPQPAPQGGAAQTPALPLPSPRAGHTCPRAAPRPGTDPPPASLLRSRPQNFRGPRPASPPPRSLQLGPREDGEEEPPPPPAAAAALPDHKAYGFSAPKGHQVVTATEYQEVILACKYPKKTISSRLEWKKLGRSVSFVYYQQALQGDFKDRAEMIDFSIRIKNVTRNDAGKYRCEVSAPSEQGQNLEEDTVTLEVLVAPAVPACEVPNSALSGTVVELRCQDKEGNPAPEYTWFKDGVPLSENPKLGSQSTNSSYTMNTKSGTLQFNTVSKLDSGEYSCEARNSVGHRRCPGKRMQVDDLNISGIIAAVVVVALVISVCGLGVCYAQRKGYFSRRVVLHLKPPQ
uniref:Junctional adhesion molecule B n=1 Tax=Canis lupus familiaris TaxID=9615 RepID=A0A8I3NUR7_CANLF